MALRLFIFTIVASVFATSSMTLAQPIVIAHRGASAYRPENTLAAFELAADQGADLIETDVVLTKDGVLVCSHDLILDHQTNIAELPAFANRKATRQVDGKEMTGWFVCDLTLAEVKQLRVRARRRPDGQIERPELVHHDDRFEVTTLAEMIALCKPRTTGLLIELKLPSFHQREMQKSLALESLAELDKAGIKSQADLPITIQSFEADDLKLLHQELLARQSDFTICRLLSQNRDEIPSVLPYATIIGPSKTLVMDATKVDGKFVYASTGLVREADDVYLKVFVYTFRNDAEHDGVDTMDEMKAHLEDGVDGLITDNPDLGRKAVDAFKAEGK